MAFWKKFYKSKYTGAEIDAAIAKADTVPAVTVEDAGKALVVDEEGKIVPATAYPLFNLSETEITPILTSFITALVGATDKLTESTFSITDETVVASIKSKIESITNYGFLTIEGFDGKVACYKSDGVTINTVPFMQGKSGGGVNYKCMIHLSVYFKESDNTIAIKARIQKLNNAA